ncbi:hypothetical protein F2Q68_00019198 [Brassica cretica]|uniref:IBB domain-containing protein n=2 Tax=Brassica cretica TaxID=69181 RepID=A0ABQ7D2I6_BRACR|nr:hypothetical protein F2Q68_00019198 [Brassica cretica]KAF3565155.1 hypothetical protein DY000_02011916 [Brassica cretica]
MSENDLKRLKEARRNGRARSDLMVDDKERNRTPPDSATLESSRRKKIEDQSPTPALSEQPESEKRQDLFGEVREKAEKKGKICLESAYSANLQDLNLRVDAQVLWSSLPLLGNATNLQHFDLSGCSKLLHLRDKEIQEIGSWVKECSSLPRLVT